MEAIIHKILSEKEWRDLIEKKCVLSYDGDSMPSGMTFSEVVGRARMEGIIPYTNKGDAPRLLYYKQKEDGKKQGV